MSDEKMCPWCRTYKLQVVAKTTRPKKPGGQRHAVPTALMPETKRHLKECREASVCRVCGCNFALDQSLCTATECWCDKQPDVNEWHSTYPL